MKKGKLKIGRVILVLVIAIVLVIAVIFGAPKIVGMFTSQEETVEKETEVKTLGTVVLDPGHGEYDGGATYNGFLEKEITLRYALAVGKYLEANNVKVIYTRTEDKVSDKDRFTDLRYRAELGEQYNADYFISLHVNSTENYIKRSGIEIYTRNVQDGNTVLKDSKELADLIGESMAKTGLSKYLGSFDGSDLRVLRLSTTVPILIEIGYVTGDDTQYFNDGTKMDQMVKAIGDGIITKLNKGKLEPDVKLVKQPDLD